MGSNETPKPKNTLFKKPRVALALLLVISAIIAIVLTLPSETQPAPATTSTQIYFEEVDSVAKDSTFTIQVNIEDVEFMSYAAFDVRFDDSYISYESSAAGDVGGVTPNVGTMQNEASLIRIIVDFSDYALSNDGDGASGSGNLCEIHFTATSSGTSSLDFVEGQGTPSGELTLVEWRAFEQNMITDVSWVNGSVAIE
ncbi:MAG: cohesin domain-containing protein [Chloroflexota bacterium]|nr:cohesin domain-containing protein [Chloroflexota bacterium]